MKLVSFAIPLLLLFSLNEITNAQQAPLRVRKNFSSLTPAEKDSLRNGIRVMKQRPANNPTSWQFQANIHGTFQPTSPLHGQCKHTRFNPFTPAEYFLVWHRGYLFYFEKMLRDASGDPNLTLPYWNWREERSIPFEFRFPANGSNPLFQAGRTMNDGSSIPFQIVVSDLDQAMSQFNFMQFQLDLEMSPHGTIHGQVGGLMGSVPTSANDPVFWHHHGNVDRLWDHWLSSSSQRRNPSSDQYLNEAFRFADADGVTVTVTARDIISSTQLGYRYDDVPQPPQAVFEAIMADSDEKILATSVSELEGVGDQTLGFKEKRVPLQFSENGRAQFEALTNEGPAAAQKIAVRISGVSFKELPAFTYGVYVNLPDGETNDQRMIPHYVGSINFFGTDHAHDAGHGNDGVGDAEKGHSFDVELDVSDAIKKLKSAGIWDPESVTVTLRPLAPIPPKGQEEEKNRFYLESATNAELSFERIEFVTGQ